MTIRIEVTGSPAEVLYDLTELLKGAPTRTLVAVPAEMARTVSEVAAAAEIAESEAQPTEPVVEKPKRGRKPKGQGLTPELIAEGEAAGVHVDGDVPRTRYWWHRESDSAFITLGDELPADPHAIEITKKEYDERHDAAAQTAVESAVEQVQPEVPGDLVVPADEAEMRALLLDYLSAWQAKVPDNAGIRSEKLKPILDAVGATKISEVKPDKYAIVAQMVAADRAELEAEAT